MEETAQTASVVAIDIGGGTTKLALVDRRGEVRRWQAFPTHARDGEELLGKVVVASRQLQAEAEVPIAGISVAVAGFVSADGSLEYNANLPWLENIPIASLLEGELGVRVHIESDSNTACVAEYVYGQGKGSSRFLCLTGGTGLGVGMMTEGQLLRVAHGCMGDAGHIIISPEGPACSCGGRGCAEALLSTASIAKRYAEVSGRGETSFRGLVADGLHENSHALAILQEAGYWLGVAAASLASIFFPDRIAVAGGLSQAGDAFFLAVEQSFRRHGGNFPLAKVSLVRATTGQHATLVGAAACFFHPELL